MTFPYSYQRGDKPRINIDNKARQQLIELIVYKNTRVMEETGIEYVIDEDFKEIREDWTNSECERVVEVIKHKTIKEYTDTWTCPWCVLQYVNYGEWDCDVCNYANRHGICGLFGSTYASIQRNCVGLSEIISRQVVLYILWRGEGKLLGV